MKRKLAATSVENEGAVARFGAVAATRRGELTRSEETGLLLAIEHWMYAKGDESVPPGLLVLRRALADAAERRLGGSPAGAGAAMLRG
jgi:hypothetical protein